MFTNIITLVIVAVTFTLAETSNKRSLQAILGEACPLQCSGEIDNINLARLCLCTSRNKVFLYGKRNGNTAAAAPADDTSSLLRKLLAGYDSKLTVGVPTTASPVQPSNPGYSKEQLKALLAVLERKTVEEKNIKSHIKPSTTDLGLQLAGLRKADREVVPVKQTGVDTAELFRSEIGTDPETATKDDYLKWVEKEMTQAEARLLKLLQFYKLLKSTPDA